MRDLFSKNTLIFTKINLLNLNKCTKIKHICYTISSMRNSEDTSCNTQILITRI